MSTLTADDLELTIDKERNRNKPVFPAVVAAGHVMDRLRDGTESCALFVKIRGRVVPQIVDVHPSLREGFVWSCHSDLHVGQHYTKRPINLQNFYDLLRAYGLGNSCFTESFSPSFRHDSNPFVPCAPPKPLRRDGRIYFVQANGTRFVKIGYAKADVRARIETLQMGCPHELVLLATTTGTLEDEAAFHKRFSTLRERGEWFRLTDDIRTVIEELQ